MRHNVFVNDRVHVRRKQCKTCIFGPNPAVSAERRDSMVAECLQQDDPETGMSGVGVIPCHHHLYVGEPINPVCRGFYELKQNPLLRLAFAVEVNRMDVKHEMPEWLRMLFFFVLFECVVLTFLGQTRLSPVLLVTAVLSVRVRRWHERPF